MGRGVSFDHLGTLERPADAMPLHGRTLRLAALASVRREHEPPSPVELVERVRLGLADGAVLEWLAVGFGRHLAGVPLDAALRLDPPSRRRERDRALLCAAELLKPRRSTWALAEALAAAVRRFEDRVRPFIDDGRQLGPLDAALLAAHLSFPRLPSTPEGLLYLLK